MGSSTDRPPWQRASALVFVDDLDGPELSPEDSHHLGRVLRLRAGAEVCAADGTGRWRMTRFEGPAGLSPIGEIRSEERPARPITVGVALVKGDKPDLVVQKLTELGIDRIVFFAAARSVVRWNDDRAGRNIERLGRIARSACSQSRRLRVPIVEFGDIQSLLEQGAVVADFDGRAISGSDTIVLVGPEGGWETGEYADADRVYLGPNVLRTETAAIAAGILLMNEHHDHSA